MGKKATKATKKFASSGQLKKTIQARHKHQQIKKRSQNRKGAKAEKASSHNRETDMDQDEASDLDADGDESVDDDASFASVDELDEDGEDHLQELSKLAEKDPDFYKYLQENDRELLDFDPTSNPTLDDLDSDDIQSDDDAMTDARMPILTNAQILKWQKALLEQRSLRALRKLLIAFRSAAHMNEDDQVLAWSIDSSSVYNKLVTTSLRYTPIILMHHVPYKTLSNGKFKPPTQTPKFKTLQKLILSYFHNIIHMFSQLTDKEMLQLAVAESAKVLPYVVSSRKSVKLYLKKCLELWSSAQDSTRIAAFLAIRKLACATDESILDHVLKGTYMTLIRQSKSTSAYTLPSINLMKNSASEIFCLDHATAYQHAFGYIRQFEAYKQVYNWQFVHCIDFWSIVLARACDITLEKNTNEESDLKPLVYPLVQVSLGAIKLISNSRSYPFHLHVVRSLLHLTRHIETYIPIAPYLVPILHATLTTRPKSSTLRPLDLDVYIRAPQQYAKTRVYSEGIVDETVYLLSEWLASPVVQASIAFPEIVVPITVLLRKSIKNAKSTPGSGSSKDQSLVKGLLERVDESSQWVEQKRKDVPFTPGKIGSVQQWEDALKATVSESPLGKYVKVQRKAREKRRKLVEKAREGEDEILEED
ncbi:Noc2-domain-containing protein [Infundibulicybe gibba]|nr:Noc2-domain-containing protein [Infundibulicybe gibba]